MKWISKLLIEIGHPDVRPVTLFEDNEGSLKWGTSFKRTKHIELIYHFVKDLVDRGVIRVKHFSTDAMLADLLTKPLSTSRFKSLRDCMNIARGGGREEAAIKEGMMKLFEIDETLLK